MLALVILAAVSLAMLLMRPSVGFDAWRGVLASEQRIEGRTMSVLVLSIANPDAIDRDRSELISWWPPAQQVAVYAFRSLGLSLGHAVKALVVLSWFVGIASWAAYFLFASADRRTAFALMAAFALLGASHRAGMTHTGGETIYWAGVPLAVVAALASLRFGSWRRNALMCLSGLTAGALVFAKYHALIFVLSMGLAWGWSVWRRDMTWPALLAWCGGVAAGLGIALACGVGVALRAGNPLTASWTNAVATVWAWGIGGSLFALGDTFEILRLINRHLGRAAPSDGLVLAVSVAFAAVFALWVVRARHAVADAARAIDTPVRRVAWRVAISMVVVTSVALVALMLRDASISWEGRHQQYGAFLALPFLVEAWRRASRSDHPFTRAATIAAIGLWFIIPVSYGAATLVNDVGRRTPAEWNDSGSDDVPFSWTARGAGGTAFESRLTALPWFSHALVAASSWEAFLMFPGNRVIEVPEHADGATRRYAGRPESGVALLLPASSGAADIDAIEQMFVDVHRWTKVDVPEAPGVQVMHGD